MQSTVAAGQKGACRTTGQLRAQWAGGTTHSKNLKDRPPSIS